MIDRGLIRGLAQKSIQCLIVTAAICVAHGAMANTTGLNTVAGQNLLLGTSTVGGANVYIVIDTNGNISMGPNATLAGMSSGSLTTTSGYFNMASTGAINITGATTLGSTLGVSGTSTLTGRVGIGQGPGADALDVTGNVVSTGSITSAEHYYPSDIRLKTDIHVLDHALDKVLALNGVAFNWKKDVHTQNGTTNQVGFIAQDVEKIVPDIVTTNAAGIKAVDYARITPLLVNALHEQQREIEQLKATLRALDEER